MSAGMTKAQQMFITDELCPFILREQGRGFQMRLWRWNHPPGTLGWFDGLRRVAPKCGTVSCIGGSIEILLNQTPLSFSGAGALIGLNEREARKLFHQDVRWPLPFRARWHKAKTPLAKARVAVALLKLVAKTKGACLHPKGAK